MITSKVPGGYINLSVEVVVPPTRAMNPALLGAISQTPSGLKLGTKTWGDLAPFRQLYFERWSPTESLYKQQVEDVRENIARAQTQQAHMMRTWLRTTLF